MGDRGALDRMAPSPSGAKILPGRAARPIALGILYGRSGEAISAALAGRVRPGESRSGWSKTNLVGARGNSSLSERHEAGRHIGRLRRVHRIRRREQFHRHGKSLCQSSIYRQSGPI